MLPAPQFIPLFDAEDHAYYWQGKRKISVTQLLEWAGLREDYPAGNYRERGTAVHYACELYDAGRLDVDAFFRYDEELPEDERIGGYLRAYMLFLSEMRPKVVMTEQAMYSPWLDVAGMLDRGYIIGGQAGICDLKSGTLPPSCKYQTAAYGILLFNAVPPSHMRRWGLQLKANGKYKLATYKDESDYERIIRIAQERKAA